MGLLLVEFGGLVEKADRAVDADAHEAVAPKSGEDVLVAALLALHDRRIEDDLYIRPAIGIGGKGFRTFPFFQYRVDDLLGGLARHLAAALRAVRHGGGAVEDAEVVVDFRHCSDDGARVAARRVLLDGNRRGQSLDLLHVGLLHPVEELPRIGRERLYVAALAFGVEGVERKRRLSTPGEARHDR